MDKVYNFLFKDLQLKAKDAIVVGISGGPDSMVLLHLLIQLKKEKNIDIICAHVNHGLRIESEEEQEFVAEYCKNNDITFEYKKITNYANDNFHNQARIIRYEYFESLIKKYNSKYLLTAHHGDDLIETVLMRIVRGSTLKGYSGFSKLIENNGYSIARPLIFINKEEILEFAKINEIPYRLDKSNEKDLYTRNRYRKYVLPFLKQEDPKVNEKFLKFSETLIAYDNHLKEQMLLVFNEVYQDNVLNLEKFKKLDAIIQEEIISQIFEGIYNEDLMLINDTHVEAIIAIINSNKPNTKIDLPNNLQAIKSYDSLKIIEAKEKNEYNLKLEANNNLPNGKKIDLVDQTESDNNNICRLNNEDIKLPLYIRSRKEADKMKIKGMTGTKKLKDIFIDEKINSEDRDVWPVVVDADDTIIWLPGLKKSKINQPKNKKCDIILKYY